LPDLASKHQVLAARQSSVIHGLLAKNVYFVALAGFVTYYGLGKLAELENSERPTYVESQSSRKISTSILLVIYATYPMLIAYLTTELNNPIKLFLITIAMSVHFIGTDYGKYHRDKYFYDRVIRWILVAATFLGWVIGIFTEVSKTTIALWFAFIAGAIIINTIREEIPELEVSRFLPFLAGTITFTIIILIVNLFPN